MCQEEQDIVFEIVGCSIPVYICGDNLLMTKKAAGQHPVGFTNKPRRVVGIDCATDTYQRYLGNVEIYD